MHRKFAFALIALIVLTGCQGKPSAPAQPPAESPSSVAVAADPYDQAQTELKAGNFEAAVKLLQAAVSARPDDARAYTDLSFAYIRLQQWPQAIQAGEAALRLDPKSTAARFNTGRAYLGAKQYTQAEGHLSTAYWANEQNPDVAWYLGQAYEGEGSLLSAQRVYRKALARTPADKDFAEAVSRVQAALDAQTKMILRADLTGDGRMSEVWARPGELRVVSPTGNELLALTGDRASYYTSFQAKAVDLGVPVPVLWVTAGPGCPGGPEHGLYAYDKQAGQMKKLVWHGCATAVDFDKGSHSVSFATRVIPAYVTTRYVFDGKNLVKASESDDLIRQFIWPGNVDMALSIVLSKGHDIGLIADKAKADAFIKAWAGKDAAVTVDGATDGTGKAFIGTFTVKNGARQATGTIGMSEKDGLWQIDRLEWK